MCDGQDAVCSQISTSFQTNGKHDSYGFRVLAAVDAKMVKPTPDRPYEGMINIHSEISPMASSEYEQGR